jgi:hypothetical protein
MSLVALVADSQAPEVVQVREATLDDPALPAEARPVRCSAASHCETWIVTTTPPEVTLAFVIITDVDLPAALAAKASAWRGTTVLRGRSFL